MRKRFLIPAAIFALITPVHAFGKYKSQVEAKEACIKWADKGLKYSYEDTKSIPHPQGGYYPNGYQYKFKSVTYEKTNRYCEFEITTRQYLGYEQIGIKKGQHFKEYAYENMKIGEKIKKYFKF
mgnify:CR=1 FL=1